MVGVDGRDELEDTTGRLKDGNGKTDCVSDAKVLTAKEEDEDEDDDDATATVVVMKAGGGVELRRPGACMMRQIIFRYSSKKSEIGKRRMVVRQKQLEQCIF